MIDTFEEHHAILKEIDVLLKGEAENDTTASSF